MLKAVPGGAAVVACSTCRRAADARGDSERSGARLVAALRRVKARDAAYDGVAIQQMPCLFACDAGCAVHLRAPDKIGYVLGRSAPTEDAARAILAYAGAYARSEWGEVPFHEWPDGVKGHFITRTPPAGFVVE